jgi:hypothetical protein
VRSREREKGRKGRRERETYMTTKIGRSTQSRMRGSSLRSSSITLLRREK